MTKPFIAAAERNKDAILAALRPHFAHSTRVLEIGSGTGQHAVHFATALPHLVWQPSDLAECQTGMRAWVDAADLENLEPPLVLDVMQRPWRPVGADAVFSSNTVHYMPWACVVAMFEEISGLLSARGVFALYGPFNYDGGFVSAGNRDLDLWLRSRDPRYGIRDFEALVSLASKTGMRFRDDCPMPANNRLLVWQGGQSGRENGDGAPDR